jgi:hypothetical protein
MMVIGTLPRWVWRVVKKVAMLDIAYPINGWSGEPFHVAFI